MLSTKVFKSGSNAQKYYSHADYYGAEAKGVWFGEGAKDFNLKGSFDAKSSQGFKDLLDGKMSSGQMLGKTDKDGKISHRCGMDLTFSSPKSVSIQMHVLGNKEQKQALQEARTRALNTTLKYIEESGMVHTRKGKGGKVKEPVHNLTFATFAHTTNRKLEPQDHVHCFLANAALCSDGKYRTIVWDKILKNNKYIGQIFRNELALEVQKLGYDVRTTKLSDGSTSFELKTISQNLIDAFSTRRKELVELFKKFNVKTKEGKDKIVINSRESKKTSDKGQLKETWAKVVKEVAEKEKSAQKAPLKDRALEKVRILLDKTVYRSLVTKMETPQNLTVGDVAQLSLESVTYHNSAFSKEDFHYTFSKYGIGKYGISEAKQGYNDYLEAKKIIKSDKGDHLLTTKELVTLEKEILKMAKKGLGKCSPIIKEDKFNNRFKLYEKERQEEAERKSEKIFKLNPQQRKAVKHVLTSKDRVLAIQGRPGVGKSTVVEAVKDIVGSKVKLIGTAFTASAAKSLQESSGVASKTLHAFVGKLEGYAEGRGKGSFADRQAELKNSIVIVDEASFVGTKLMHKLTKLSDIFNFRVVPIGDGKQLGAVEAGKPFEQLLDVVKSVTLKTIVRQKSEEHKQAVTKAAQDKILESFKIHEKNIKGGSNFVHQSVNRYLSLSKSEQDNTLLISPSRIHRDEINLRVVERLTNQGKLGKQGYDLHILKRAGSANAADFNNTRAYQKGCVVVFNKSYRAIGIKQGDLLELSDKSSVSNTLLFKKSFRNIRYQLKPNMDYSDKLEVFEKEKIKIHKNMKLRFTKNVKEKNFINSETAEIQNINNLSKTITLKMENKSIRTVSFSDLRYVDIGYCTTVHASQGKTVDRLIASLSSVYKKLNTHKSWLVSISRHKSNLHVYTQSKEAVRMQIARNKGTEKSALDIVKNTAEKPEQSIVNQL